MRSLESILINSVKKALIIPLLFSITVAVAQDIKITGSLRDETNTPISSVTIQANGKRAISGKDGNYNLSLKKGEQAISFTCIGYSPITKKINLTKDTIINIVFDQKNINIDEVFITAQESKNLETSSVITKEAMQLLQPSSFSDLLELLPGGRAQDPNLTSFNAIKLREPNLKGKTMTSNKYDMSSLGVSFVMDGAPINTNSDLQSVNGYTTSGLNGNVSNTNRGLDLRSLGTDDIEKVTIVRGIPSVEYGDLTSGLVLIERKKGYSPYTLRAKTDGFGKLFSLSKGYSFKDDLFINADIGYIRAQSDPTNSFVNFSRVSGSIRLDKTWKGLHSYNFRSNLDYNTTLDNNKTDPDNSFVADSYYGRKQRFGWNNQFLITFNPNKWIQDLRLTSNLTFQKDIIEQDRWIQARTATILVNSLEQGSHEAQFLTPSYLSNLYVQGLPFTAYTKLVSQHKINFNEFQNNIKLGIESNFSKNYGKGQVYDLNYPTDAAISARPRAFKDIPGYHTLSLFAEDNFEVNFNQFRLDAAVGIRAFTMTSLSKEYTMSGKIYAEPRTNVRLHLPRFTIDNKPFGVTVGGGLGILKKIPTLDHLYPNLHYRDLVELNFFHNNPEYRIAQAYTDITNPVNYNILPATNKKFEVNTDFNYDGNRLSFTFFKERMNDAFRPNSVIKNIEYNKYDNTSIDIPSLTQKPSASDFTHVEAEEQYSFSQTQNGSQIHKEGLEFQLTTRRFRGINTRFTVNGAWYKTTYTNSLPIWKINDDIIHNGKIRQVSGLYLNDDGYIREMLNSNFTIDSYLPNLGLNLSTSFQALWFYKSQNMPKLGIPIAYQYTEDKIVRPFTSESLNDPTLKQLVEGSTIYLPNTEPLDLQINLKASKSFKSYLKASVFVNRLLLYRPNYTTLNGINISRTLDAPYFGMELTLTL